MDCGILTFHFAHNYGAVLQAYSLKYYLGGLGYETAVINYVPKKIYAVYTLNPFAEGSHPRVVAGRLLAMPKRMKQVCLFKKFIVQNLTDGKVIDDAAGCQETFRYLDVVFCGSDQIWNDDITGETTTYYADADKTPCRKVAYAASFGKDDPSDFQVKCIRQFLPYFQHISVREHSAAVMIEQYLQRKVRVVLDPVFLHSAEFWKLFSRKSCIKRTRPFFLYYSLQNRRGELAAAAERMSEKSKCELLIIHPTARKQDIKGKQLYNVGPYEFLWLVSHAEYVFTDSFHAFSFSVIFGRKVAHTQCLKGESRIASLIETVQGLSCLLWKKKNIAAYDMANLDRNRLSKLINEAEEFIVDSLNW